MFMAAMIADFPEGPASSKAGSIVSPARQGMILR
jgi:hypothetical protein